MPLPSPALQAELCQWDLPVHADPQGALCLHVAQAPWDAQTLANALELPLHAVAAWGLCDSTNTRLLQDPVLQLGVAEAQWAGRGRQGRPWHSPWGRHLYLSLAVSPVAPALAVTLPLAAALSLHTLLAPQVPGLWIKWPNDLWIGARKLGGILLEGKTQGDQQRIVLGIGLNVSADPQLPADAITLADTPCLLDRHGLAVAIVQQFWADQSLLVQEGFGAFSSRWEQADGLRGRQIEVWQNDRHFTGVAQGLAKDGRLLLDTPDGQQICLSAADIRLRPRP